MWVACECGVVVVDASKHAAFHDRIDAALAAMPTASEPDPEPVEEI